MSSEQQERVSGEQKPLTGRVRGLRWYKPNLLDKSVVLSDKKRMVMRDDEQCGTERRRAFICFLLPFVWLSGCRKHDAPDKSAAASPDESLSATTIPMPNLQSQLVGIWQATIDGSPLSITFDNDGTFKCREVAPTGVAKPTMAGNWLVAGDQVILSKDTCLWVQYSDGRPSSTTKPSLFPDAFVKVEPSSRQPIPNVGFTLFLHSEQHNVDLRNRALTDLSRG